MLIVLDEKFRSFWILFGWFQALQKPLRCFITIREFNLLVTHQLLQKHSVGCNELSSKISKLRKGGRGRITLRSLRNSGTKSTLDDRGTTTKLVRFQPVKVIVVFSSSFPGLKNFMEHNGLHFLI